MRKNDQKFLAPIATYDVRLTQTLTQECGNRSNYDIAYRMTVRIVNFFEMVNIYHRYYYWVLLPVGTSNFVDGGAFMLKPRGLDDSTYNLSGIVQLSLIN
jgi:hypothetical protein